MKQFKTKKSAIITCIACLSAVTILSVPAFAAGSEQKVTLTTTQTLAISGETEASTNAARVNGTVYAESKHQVVYHARSKKNNAGVWFDRETRRVDDLTTDQEIKFVASPLGNDVWRLEIEPYGPTFTQCHADGTINNS